MWCEPCNPKDFAWIEDRTGCVLTRHARGIKVLDKRGAIRGMVAYDAWTETTCQAHMAVDTPIAWRVLTGPAFVYPFQQAKKLKILGAIPEHNERSLAMARALGFRVSHTIEDGWAVGDDLVLIEMNRDECLWLTGQRRAA